MRTCAPGKQARLVQALGDRRVERVEHERRLAAAGNPGDAGEGAERDAGVDALEVVLGRAGEGQPAAVLGLAADQRQRDLATAGEILAGQALGRGQDLGGRALGDHDAAVDAGAGAHVDHVVGLADRVLVVLDHDHRVAEVAEVLQRLEQAVVVPLMQPDRGLVEHVEHARQARADLRGEADPLALAARKRAGIARERQIAEADVLEKAEALVDLLEDPARDLVLLRSELRRQGLEPVGRGLDRELGHFADVPAADLDRERLGLEPVAGAGLAGRAREIAAELLLEPGAVGLAPTPLQVRQHALERPLRAVAPDAIVVAELDLLLARAVQDQVPHRLGQLFPGRVQARPEMLGDAVERLQIISRGRTRPGLDRAVVEAFFRIGHDQRRVHVEAAPEAVAGRTGAVRAVEREQPGLDLLDREARDRAGELRGQDQLLGRVRVLDDQEAVGVVERGLDALGEALLEAPTCRRMGQHQAIDHELDVVLELLVELRRLVQLVQLAVDLDPLEARALQLGQFLPILALAAAHDRAQQIDPGALRQGHDPVDHLGDGLALDRQAGRGRIRNADPGEQQAQVVVDFRNRADRGARVLGRRLLLDRDRRRQARDRIDVRLLHQLEELAGVCGEALDVAPLAVGVNRIERERAFSRTRKAGDHDQPVARQIEIDRLQIVLARAADADEVVHLSFSSTRRSRHLPGRHRLDARSRRDQQEADGKQLVDNRPTGLEPRLNTAARA